MLHRRNGGAFRWQERSGFMAVDVAVVGAGPYGLSVASHLLGAGIQVRCFGRPMQTWQTQMPHGMFLKSEGFASTLFAPRDRYTLERYCSENEIAYASVGRPVSLQLFSRYGVAFQRKLVPDLEPVDVIRIGRSAGNFELELEDGKICVARRVVMAVGIRSFGYLPPELRGHSAEAVAHSSAYGSLDGFAGRKVAVVGAGASAIDCAAILCDKGADVHIIARDEEIRFHAPPGDVQRSLLERLRQPQSGLGPGWRSRACTDGPIVFHFMPASFRHLVVRRHLGASAGWWTKDVVTSHATMHLGQSVQHADSSGGRVRLDMTTNQGERRSLVVDHVIAATGYRPDVERLDYMAPALRQSIRTTAGSPHLSMNFQSSVPGLYFTGLAAATSFGPVCRFAFGAGFTSRRLSRHLRQAIGARSVPATEDEHREHVMADAA